MDPDRSERIFKVGPVDLRGARRKPDPRIVAFRSALFEAIDGSWIGRLVRWLGKVLA